MVLQSLNRYYDILLKDSNPPVAPFGYSVVGISFALNVSQEGELLDIFPLFEEVERGKKTVAVPRQMVVPAQVKRSSNVAPNFLWDSTTYVLGISKRDDIKPRYSQERHEAFQEVNSRILGKVGNPSAQAVLAFFDKYEPEKARDHPAIQSQLEALLSGGNVVFQFQGGFVHDDPDIRKVWEEELESRDSERMQCLVTGKVAPVARLHPSLKRIRGAQSSGATLVGFNAPAYESFNREQGQISPVSKKATFAYTSVLNYLLSDENPNKKFFLGDTAVVYWAESENRAFETTFANLFDPTFTEKDRSSESRRRAETVLKQIARKVRRGEMVDLAALMAELGGENPRFYILGLAPNAARVSVRFFITDPFEKIVEHIMTHYHDLSIVKEYEDQPDYLTVWRILNETVSKKARDKEAAPLLAGSVFRAVLTNRPYPAALYNAIITRIRADMDDKERQISKINYVRAAVIKAYLLRKYRHRPEHPIQEVLVMALNEQSTNPAYVLGRLFAVLEKVQREAIGEVNASIKDRYFTSACASPATVFPILLRLSQHHISKAEYGHVSDRRIQDILELLDLETNPIPPRLTLDEQGVFVLGYYHQRADFFKKKDSEEEETSLEE